MNNISLILGLSTDRRPIHWSAPDNGHIAIYGTSGAGKSHFIRKLLLQLPLQNTRALVFDCSGDFSDGFGTELLHDSYENIDLRSDAFSVSPFRCQNRKGIREAPEDIARRISGLLQEALRAHYKQAFNLEMALTDYLKNTPEEIASYKHFLNWLQQQKAHVSKLNPLLAQLYSIGSVLSPSNSSFDWKLDTAGITILNYDQITGSTLRQTVTELIINDIWSQRVQQNNPTSPVVLVFDECQHFHFFENSYLQRILREGRKYGLNGWYSTQWIDNKRTSSALGQASLQAFFRQDYDTAQKLAKLFSSGDREQRNRYMRTLSSLPRGSFLFHLPGGLPVLSSVEP